MKKLAFIFPLMAAFSLVMGACSDGNGVGNVNQCLEACTAAADCVTTGTTENDWKCENSRCAANFCSSDTECVAIMSGWITECTDDAGCAGQKCIDIGGGVGRCATEPVAVTCADLTKEDIDMPAIDGSGTVTVCGNPGYTCSDGMCMAPGCTSDDECTIAQYPYCVGGNCVECKADGDCTGAMTKCTSLGLCGCASDEECTGGLTKCTSVGICGCVDDSECTLQATDDKCYDGFCGCSSADVCTDTPAGANTTWVCEKQ